MKKNNDPLMLAELDPSNIAHVIEEKQKAKPPRPQTEAEKNKEERLKAKEERLQKGQTKKETPYVEEMYYEVHDKSKLLDC